MDRIKIGKALLGELNNYGYQAYLVGGTVRDYLLGLESYDIDIATSARPEEVMKLWPEAIPTGIKYGTVTVIYEGQAVEVTTFREESDYHDFRRPESVNFGDSLAADVARRDFTINALAMDYSGNVIDYYAGREALASRVIKTVGSPEERFREDPLRMLRAIRFVAQLGFEIEASTWEQLLVQAPYIQYVALERIKKELDRLLVAKHTSQAVAPLYESGLFKWIAHFKETKIEQLDVSLISRLMHETTDVIARWYLLLFQLTDDDFNHLIVSFPLTKKEQGALYQYRSVQQILAEELSENTLKGCLLSFDEEIIAEMIKLIQLLNTPETSKDYEETVQYRLTQLKQLSNSLPAKSIKDLAIDGNNLIAELNLSPGKQIGELMEELLRRVVFAGLANEKNALLREAAKIRGEMIEQLSDS